jgi:hypothetical protein
MTLWHGGKPGLKVGDWLLPPDETGFEWTSAAINKDAGLLNPNYRSDRVYATTDRNLASAFAGYWTREPRRPGGGWLYEVELEDGEDDSDFPSLVGVSYQARRGRIIAVVQTGVGWQPKHVAIFDHIMAIANRRAENDVAEDHQTKNDRDGG